MLPVIFFIISLGLLTSFLVVKVRHFNAGRIEHNFPNIVQGVKEDVLNIQKQVTHHAKRSFKKTVFTIGKAWVIFVYLSEKKLRKHFPKLFSKEPDPAQRPSFFLSTIMEYKMRMKHFKKKIREEDTKGAETEEKSEEM